MGSLRKLPDKCSGCEALSSTFVQWSPGKYKCSVCHRPISFIEPEPVVGPVKKPKPDPEGLLKLPQSSLITRDEMLEPKAGRKPDAESEPAIISEKTKKNERANESEKTRDMERATVHEKTIEKERAVGVKQPKRIERAKSLEETRSEERAITQEKSISGERLELQEAFKGVKHGTIFKVLDEHKEEVLEIVSSIGQSATDRMLGLGLNTINAWKTSRKIDIVSVHWRRRRPPLSTKVAESHLHKEKDGRVYARNPRDHSGLLGYFGALEEPATISSIKKLMELTTQEITSFREGFEKQAAEYGDGDGQRYEAYMEVEIDYYDSLREVLGKWIQQIGDKDIVVLGLVAFKEALEGIKALEPPDPDEIKSNDAPV